MGAACSPPCRRVTRALLTAPLPSADSVTQFIGRATPQFIGFSGFSDSVLQVCWPLLSLSEGRALRAQELTQADRVDIRRSGPDRACDGSDVSRSVKHVNYWESDSGPGDPMRPRSREDAVPTLLPTTHLSPTASWLRCMSWLLAVSEHDKFLGRAGEPRWRPRRCSGSASGIKVSPLASRLCPLNVSPLNGITRKPEVKSR